MSTAPNMDMIMSILLNDDDEEDDNNGSSLTRYRLPCVETLQHVLSLSSNEAVRTGVDRFFKCSSYNVAAKYPCRLQLASTTTKNEHKQCKMCGNMGHNTMSHQEEGGLVEEGLRQVVSILRNGHRISTEELMAQVACLLVAISGLARMLSVEGLEDDADIRHNLVMLMYLYQIVVAYIKSPTSTHYAHVAVGDEASPLLPVMPAPDVAAPKIRYRESFRILNEAIDRLGLDESSYSRVGVRVGSVPLPGMTWAILIPDVPSGAIPSSRSEDAWKWAQVEREFLKRLFQDLDENDTETLKACWKDGRVVCKMPAQSYSSCSHCNCFGHTRKSCLLRTCAINAAFCLAKLRDPQVAHRLQNRDYRIMIVNMSRYILSLAYGVYTDPETWQPHTSLVFDRVHGDSASSLLLLMRIYNDTVRLLASQSRFRDCIEVSPDHRCITGAFDDGDVAMKRVRRTEHIPPFAKVLAQSMSQTLNDPAKQAGFVKVMWPVAPPMSPSLEATRKRDREEQGAESPAAKRTRTAAPSTVRRRSALSPDMQEQLNELFQGVHDVYATPLDVALKRILDDVEIDWDEE